MDSPANSTNSTKSREGPRKYAYNREGARERETHLYLPYWGFSDSEKFAQESVGNYPNASRDNVLTVFAQLAALRMNAQRAIISLFDKRQQHVIAEATPKSGLRGAEGRDQGEGFWLGVGQFPRERITMCYHAMKSFVEDQNELFVVNDLTKDERFRDHESVTGHPHNTFYASVPIQSPDDYIIGAVAILDNKPWDGIFDEQRTFLTELAATVMDHLLSQRAMREEYREEKMVRALGLFVKGKSDLNEWFDSGESSKHRDQMGQVNKKLERMQVSGSGSANDDDLEDKDEDQNGNRKGSGKSDEGGNRPSTEERNKHESPIKKFHQSNKEQHESKSESPEGSESQKKQRPKLSPTTSHLQDSLAPTNVRSVVNRAASMIYQALDLEGVMFIDASVYARRQTVGSNQNEQKRDEYNIEHQERKDCGEDDVPSATQRDSRSNSTASENEEEARSLVLGHYTSTTSEGGVDLSDSHYVSLSGSFINHLIDQYPRGKIFHIEEDGSIALSYEGVADEMNYSVNGSRGAATSSSDSVDVRQETSDVKQLMKVLPDARCIAIYPIWDFQRGRYFTINVVWTNDPGRVLSEPKDLTYLAAFSNTVMAEVSRLDLEAADRAKGDFISSISHELRSPLHGLLGTVELLQEMVTGYAQHSLIETVYSCGRTLLDTLNHLLDYAKINTLTRPGQTEKSGKKGFTEAQPAVPGSLQDEDLGVLVQEVVEGILAGVEYQRRGAEGGSNERRLSKSNGTGRLMTIVDIEWNDNWRYSIYAGAWRRVVMNLFGNALKYTQTGYIRLLMKSDTLKRDGRKSVPAIRMTFSDSGRGMSKDFIVNHLYTAFHQEDTTAPGLGVGLHLVHQIVKSLNGTINFTSDIGRGTDVDVVLPIDPPEESALSSRAYGSLKEKLEGKTISLFTRSSKLGDIGMDPKVFDHILTSLGRMTTGWFGLRVLTTDEHDRGDADFAIVTEHEYRMYYRKGSSEPQDGRSGEIQPTYPLIVLSERTSGWRTIGETVDDSAIFLTQPVSPKSLATAFEHCLASPSQSGLSTPRKWSSHVSHVDDGESASDGRPTPTDGEEETQDESTTNKPPDSQGARRILLVEDNQVNLKVLEMAVKTAGLGYQTATNGLEALEKFKKEQFDVVIMDVSMPVMDGLTATREMRKFERRNKRRRTTIIALTAVLSASTQHEATVSGIDLFLTKPAPLKQLKEMLRKLSEGKKIAEK
ncbi:hybrid sensor histidine kinase/response regulator [Aspergillus mulundensis]|uniref:histidine kinase n=1 Tax=Aspergillus mulundensis TaxID=1810919 RepID=A0A3D8SB86_9EURO|nr:hypothetical protein DSM5745_03859 [Aspergillus mulundensis]RDW83533.1 hypothetical protein DSM5745_03859 [Aspergillus mulundensis]